MLITSVAETLVKSCQVVIFAFMTLVPRGYYLLMHAHFYDVCIRGRVANVDVSYSSNEPNVGSRLI